MQVKFLLINEKAYMDLLSPSLRKYGHFISFFMYIILRDSFPSHSYISVLILQKTYF